MEIYAQGKIYSTPELTHSEKPATTCRRPETIDDVTVSFLLCFDKTSVPWPVPDLIAAFSVP